MKEALKELNEFSELIDINQFDKIEFGKIEDILPCEQFPLGVYEAGILIEATHSDNLEKQLIDMGFINKGCFDYFGVRGSKFNEYTKGRISIQTFI